MENRKLEGKVALVAGASRAAGRGIAVQLGAAGATVYCNGQSLSSGQLAKVYGFTDLDGSQPDAWRYVIEVQDAGKPADVTGYR
jgi:NAD(P)-dependent dehydrogenase (short-subunit alcohol dehydrogenase family)